MWYNEYIGLPYLDKGRDRTGVDCWGLVRLVYSEQFNIELPNFAEQYSADDRVIQQDLIAQHKEGWTQTTEPKPGSVVLFRVLGSESHVGIYVGEDKFLHVREGQDAVIEHLYSTNWRNRLVGFYNYTEKSFASLVAAPHPLRTERIVLPVQPGTTIADLHKQMFENSEILQQVESRVAIILNGRVVAKEDYAATIVQQNDVLEYRAVAGKSALSAILTLAIVFYAPYLGAQLGAAIAGVPVGVVSAGYIAAGTFIVSTVGMLLVGALFPVRPPSAPADPGSPQQQLLMNGGQNQLNKYSAIPIVLGKVRYTCPLGAQNYVFSDVENSYLNMLLVWGFGPLQVSDIHIGASSISQYENGKGIPVPVVTLNDSLTPDSDAQIDQFNSIAGRDVKQVYKGTELTANQNVGLPGPWTEVVLDQDNITKIDVSIHFPQGLRNLIIKGDNAGKTVPIACSFDIEYRQLDQSNNPVNDWGDASLLRIPQLKTVLKPARLETVTYAAGYLGAPTVTYENYYQWHRLVVNSAGVLVVRTGALTEAPESEPSAALITKQKQTTYAFGIPTSYVRLPDLSQGEIPLVDICMYGTTVYKSSTACRGAIIPGTTLLFSQYVYSTVADTTTLALSTAAETTTTTGGYGSLPVPVTTVTGNTVATISAGTIARSALYGGRTITLGTESGSNTSTKKIVTAISRNSNTVTVTCSTAHNFSANSIVTIAGVTTGTTTFNGNFTIATVPSTTTFTFVQTGANESGTVTSSTSAQFYNLLSQYVNRKDAFTHTHSFAVPAGRYEVRVRRVTTDETEPDATNRPQYVSVLQTVTGISNNKPVIDPPNTKITKTALSIKATDQLNGTIEGINALVQTICSDWDNASSRWVPRATNNPASLFLYVLTHPANAQRVKITELATTSITGTASGGTTTATATFSLQNTIPFDAGSTVIINNAVPSSFNGTYTVSSCAVDQVVLTSSTVTATGTASTQGIITYSEVSSKVDVTALQNWHNFCVTNKFTFNAVITQQRSVLDILRDICAAGRGSPAMVDGKWTVIVDDVRSQIVQHFSPHNSWGFEAVKRLPRPPHALKVAFSNEELGYQEDEVIVYNTDRNEFNSEIFEQIGLPGTTNKDQAVVHARWHLAQAKLRPEIFTLNTDLEYLVCNRGDRVKVTHEVPLWGLGSGRIKNRVSATVFDLDEEVAMETGNTYNIRIRSKTGGSNVFSVVNPGTGYYSQITVSATSISTPSVSSSSSTYIDVDDLFLFGLTSTESTDLLVLAVEPFGYQNAKLTLVDYAADLYDDYLINNFTIPAYTPNITTRPKNLVKSITDKPVITKIVSDETVMEQISPGVFKYNIRVSFDNPAGLPEAITYVEAQVDDASDLIDNWQTTIPVLANTKAITINDVQEGTQYRIRLRYVGNDGRFGPWQEYVSSVVVGTSWSGGTLTINTQNKHSFDPGSTVELYTSSDIQKNLLFWSEDFDTNWSRNGFVRVIPNAAEAPDGSFSADKLVESIGQPASPAHYITSHTISNTAGYTTVTFSVHVKAVERSNFYLRVDGLTTNTGVATGGFRLDTGTTFTVVPTTTGTVTSVSRQITNIGNGWYRASLTVQFNAAPTSFYGRVILCSNTAGTNNYVGDGVSGLLIWGAQFEPGLAMTEYVPSTLTFSSRGSVATYIDSAGTLQTAASNTARQQYNPNNLSAASFFLREAGATNSIRNSTCINAAAGTPGTLPTNWALGGNAIGSLTREVVGTGTENGINYIDIKFSGTVPNIALPEISLTFDAINSTTARIGQTWASSFYVKIVAGTTNGITTGENFLIVNNSSNALVEASSKVFNYSSLTSNLLLNRIEHSRTLISTDSAFVYNRLDINLTANAALDVTLRIGLPQLENNNLSTGASSVTIVGGGTGYTAGNTLVVTGGTGTATTLTVSTVSAGVITAVTLPSTLTGRGSYSVFPTNPVSVSGGTGTGATFNLVPYTQLGFASSPIRTSTTAVARSSDTVTSAYTATTFNGTYTVLTKPSATSLTVSKAANPGSWNTSATTQYLRSYNQVKHTVSGKSTPPSEVTGFTFTPQFSSGTLLLNWNKNTEIDIAGYEVRTEDANWGTTTNPTAQVFLGNATSCFAIPALTAGSTKTFYVKAYDYSRNYSTTASSLSYTTQKPTTVATPGYSYSINSTSDSNVVFTWAAAAAGQFDVKTYELTFSRTNLSSVVENTVVEVNALTWSTRINWVGNATLTIRAKDVLGVYSDSSTALTVGKVRPNAPSSINWTASKNQLIGDWDDVAQAVNGLPIAGYEIRTANTNWGSSGYLWRGSVSSVVIKSFNNAETNLGVTTWYINSYDTTGVYGTTGNQISYTAQNPGQPTGLQFAPTNNTNLVFKWTAPAVTSFEIAKYFVRLNRPDGTTVAEGYVDSTTWSAPIDWATGSGTFYVKAVDVIESVGEFNSIGVLKTAPSAPSNYTATVNTSQTGLILNWPAASEGTLVVAGYKLTPTGTTPGSVWSGNSLSTLVTDLQSGTNTWDLIAYDADYRESAPLAVTYTVQAISAPVYNSTTFSTSLTNATALLTWTPPVSVFGIKYYLATFTGTGLTIASTIRTTPDWEIPATWTGTGTLTVVAYSNLEIASGTLTQSNITKNPPSTPGIVEVKPQGTSLAFDWPDTAINSAGLPVLGYEIRTADSNWGTAGFTWKGSVSNSIVNLANYTTTVGTTLTWYLRTYDTANKYSNSSRPIQYTFTAPNNTVLTSRFEDTVLTSAVLILTWQEVLPTFGLKYYEVTGTITRDITAIAGSSTATLASTKGLRVGDQFSGNTSLTNLSVAAILNSTQITLSSVALGVGTTVISTGIFNTKYVNSTTLTVPADWLGDKAFTVKVVDLLGNKSTGAGSATITVAKQLPGPVTDLRTQVIDNTVLLYWNLPVSPTLPIAHTRIKKGAVWESAELIGDKSGTFTTITELAGGNYKYWAAAVDTDSNESTPISLNATVSAPPDYIFNALYRSTLGGISTKYVSHASTTLIVESTSNITAGMVIHGNGYTSGQTVAAVINSTTLTTSAAPTTTPVVNTNIRFGAAVPNYVSNSTTSLVVTSNAGISPGMSISGNGYTNQTVVSLSGTATVITSAAPTTTPVAGRQITFGFSNVLKEANTGNLVLPINSTETFAAHFTTPGWAGPSAQVAAGYPVYIQPGLTSGHFEELFDYGTTLASSQITVSVGGTTIIGNPSTSVAISTSPDNVTFTNYPSSAAIFATNFRYIKVRVTATQVTAGDIYQLSSLQVRLDSKQKTDSGNVTCVSTDTGDKTISTISRATNVVTVVTTSAHQLVTGNSVAISGVTGGTTSFNGTFTVTVSNATTFTYNQTGANESGTVSGSSLVTTLTVNTGGTIVNFGTEFFDVTSITLAPQGTTALIPVYNFIDTYQNATYSITSNTCTVTQTAHGFLTGQKIKLSFTSGSAVDKSGVYTITKVNTNTFTASITTANTSGNVQTYPESMTVYLYNNSGVRQSGTVSWTVRGY